MEKSANYTRSQWSGLSIQERIRAMNENLTLEEAQQSMEAVQSMEDSSTFAEDESSSKEPPRRTSVVEMWRRRDSQLAASAKIPPLEPAMPSPVRDRIEVSRELEKQEEKKEEDEESSATSRTQAPKPSKVRNMWNQRDKLHHQQKPMMNGPPTVGAIHTKRKLAPRPTSVDTTAEVTADDDVDLTIVPSPSKSPSTTPLAHIEGDDSIAQPPQTVRTRPSNVLDFWAQRGLTPIKNDVSFQNAAGGSPGVISEGHQDSREVVTSPWKNPNAGSPPSASTANKNATSTVATTPVAGNSPPKISVVNRWKQRVASPSPDDETSTETPNTPEKSLLSSAERRKAPLISPAADSLVSPRSKVTDRWINRQLQQSPAKQQNTTSRKVASNVCISSIPGIPASPTSRTAATAATSSTTSSFRSHAAASHTDDDAAIEGADSGTVISERSGGPTFYRSSGSAPSTSAGQTHLTKRWSNRLNTDESHEAAGSLPAESQANFISYSSLPTPRRKSNNETVRTQLRPLKSSAATTPKRIIASFNYSSAPSTPKGIRSLPSTPSSKQTSPLLTPNTRNADVDAGTKSFVASPQSEPRQRPPGSNKSTLWTPKLRIPDFKPNSLPRSPNAKLQDMNDGSSPKIQTDYGKNVSLAPPSPLSPPRTAGKMQTLSPRFRYESDSSPARKQSPKSWPQFPVPSSLNHSEFIVKPAKVLVLISGQSLSRGQSSIRQQISTILNGHKIPFEEMDGSILSVRDRRNELFKISGLWAHYPQIFLREQGQTVFWGTWETLQQCNDAGRILEEFAPERLGGQSALAVANVSSASKAPVEGKSDVGESFLAESAPAQDDVQRRAASGKKPPTPNVDRIPKAGIRMPDGDDDERISISSPLRKAPEAVENELGKVANAAEPGADKKKSQGLDKYVLRQNASAVVSGANKTKPLGRKHNNLFERRIDEDAVVDNVGVAMDVSVNTAMDESLTVQTVEESVNTASTAPRLGAKSLGSLVRQDQRSKRGSVPDSKQRSKTSPPDRLPDKDMDAILQPVMDDEHVLKKKIDKAPILMSWPPPKKSYSSFSSPGRSGEPISQSQSPPPSRSGSPQFPASLKMNPPVDPSSKRPSSRASSVSDASESGSGAISSALSKRDFNSPRAKRIGQRLIEKKRELQAHRQRIRKIRSTDSSDVMSTATGNENDPCTESIASSNGSHHILLGVEDNAKLVFQKAQAPNTPRKTSHLTPNEPKTPSSALGSPAVHTSPANSSVSPSLNFSHATKGNSPATPTALSRHNAAHSPAKGAASWITNKSAFSPVVEHSPAILEKVAHRPEPLTSPTIGLLPSPKNDLSSPNSDGGLSFLDVRSDGSNSVTSRGSALSLRAEKLLKQRRQKGTLAGVEEADENSEGRKHAQELTRNVVYGHPKQRIKERSEDKARKWGLLRVNTSKQQDSTLAPNEIDAGEKQRDISGLEDDFEHNARDPPGPIEKPADEGSYTMKESALDETETMTRQRAGLSSRYTTSARFIDNNAEAMSPPPPTSRSAPGNGFSTYGPESTKSAPPASGGNVFSGTFSNDSQDTRGSSEGFRSMSSQISKNDSSYHTSRQSVASRHSLTMASTSQDVRSNHGIHDDFVAESAYSYDALRNAYSTMTFGQLAADFAGEVSNALNLKKIQHDVKKVFETSEEITSTSSPRQQKRGFGCADLVPYDEEDVAIEVEYMEDSVYDDEPMHTPAYGFCQAKSCGVASPTGAPSFEEPSRGRRRRRRVGEV